MKVIYEYPPNIEEIDAKFNVKGKPIIYTWGDIIYCPIYTVISPELYVHEGIHSKRQTSDLKNIEAWWARYLVDDEFRLNEELLAHKAEYRKFCDGNKDRNARNLYLNSVSSRLSSSMYGNMMTQSQARKIINGN